MTSRAPADPTRRRWWLGAAAGTAVLALAAHNTREVVRTRTRAQELNRELDHAGTFGYGIGEPLRLAVVGDSSAAGFGLRDASVAMPRQIATRLAKAAGRPVEVTSLAKDGTRTCEVSATQVPLLRRLAPDVVVVVVGVNDAVGRTVPTHVGRDTHELVDALEAAVPHAALAYVGCPNLRWAPGLPKPLHLVVGLACRQVARAQRRALVDRAVTYIDLYGRLDDEDFGPDGFHPGAQGSAKVAERVVAALTAQPSLATT